MSVQYLANLKAFRVSYRDHLKTARDGQARYTSARYHFIDEQGRAYVPDYKPTASMIRHRKKELELIAKELEEQSKQGLIEPAKKVKDNITLIAMLEAVKSHPTKAGNAQSTKKAKSVITDFIGWLTEKAPRMSAKELTKKAIMSFLRDCYAHAMLGTLAKQKKVLSTAFRILCEDNNLSILNPFEKIHTIDLISIDKGKGKTIFISGYTEDYIHEFYSYVRSLNNIELEIVFYLLICTGWRAGDIVNLESKQIDLENRTITLLHNKTQKTTQARTIIHITDYLLSLLKSIKFQRSTIFSFAPCSLKDKALRTLHDYMREHKPIGFTTYKTLKGERNSHNLHSFRKSFITICKKAGYNNELVRYIAGHAGKSIEERHYNTFLIDPKGSTDSIIRYAESVALHGKQSIKNERLRALLELANANGYSLDDLQALLNSP